MAISTEVAEHIEEEYADTFVDNLTNASDCILFSAAIPGQGGEHHVNEQWQSYWVKKFENRCYEADFTIRNHFWNDASINTWRRQNIIMFRKSRGNGNGSDIIDVIHPDVMKYCMDRCQRTIGASVEHMLKYPEITEAIRGALEPLVEQNKKIIIYPYGINGRLCELMLIYLFHYENFLIVDNKRGGKEKGILTFDNVQNRYKDMIILDVCSNINIHQELLDEINGSITEMDCITVFEI